MSLKMETLCISDLMSKDISFTTLNNIIKNGARIILNKDDIMIISDDIEGNLYIVADKTDSFKRSNALIDYNDYYFVMCYDEDIAEYLLSKNLGFTKIVRYHIYKYNKKEHIEVEDADFRVLDNKYVDLVYENYDYYSHVEVAESIRAGKIFGLFVDNNLVGFIGIHHDDSMGIFKILEEYQGQGYGYKLEASMINYLLDNDMSIICNVEFDNEKSINLQNKLGLVKADKTEYWLMRDEEQ